MRCNLHLKPGLCAYKQLQLYVQTKYIRTQCHVSLVFVIEASAKVAIIILGTGPIPIVLQI